jgi:hypothetical protein
LPYIPPSPPPYVDLLAVPLNSLQTPTEGGDEFLVPLRHQVLRKREGGREGGREGVSVSEGWCWDGPHEEIEGEKGRRK